MRSCLIRVMISRQVIEAAQDHTKCYQLTEGTIDNMSIIVPELVSDPEYMTRKIRKIRTDQFYT